MSDKPTPNVNLYPKFGFSGLTVNNNPPNFSPGPCTPKVQWPHATLPPAGFLYTEEEALSHFWTLRQFDLSYAASSDDGATPPDNINSVTGSLTARPALYPTDDLPRRRVCLAAGTSDSATSLNDKYPSIGAGALVGVDGSGMLDGSAFDRIFRRVPIVEFFDDDTSLGWGLSLGWLGSEGPAILGPALLYSFGTGVASFVDITLGVWGGNEFPLLGTPDRVKFARLQLTATMWLQLTIAEVDGSGSADVIISGDGTGTLAFDVQLSGEGDNTLTIAASNAHIYTGPP